MPYQVTVDQESSAPGTEVYIHGLGTFANGETAEVSDAQVQAFSMLNSTVDVEIDPDTGQLTLLPQAGPTLEEVVDEMVGVTIAKVDGSLTPPASTTVTTPVASETKPDAVESGTQQGTGE